MTGRGTAAFGIRNVVADPVSGRIELHYDFDDASASFVERIELPPSPDAQDSEAFQDAARLLLLVAGTSYYKSQAPAAIQIDVPTTQAERDLVSALYDHGLREFAYTNGLAVPLLEEIRWAGNPVPASASASTGSEAIGRPLVPFGGGKDSTVVLSLLPEADAATVNPTTTHHDVARILGRELIAVRRFVDQLDELTRPDRLNGHVPITAIVSSVCLALAVRDGFTSVVLANEQAADEPTLISDHPASAGRAVNHQWSKGATFEALLDAALVSRGIGVRYFSWLRDVSETDIIAILSGQTEALGRLVSCNRAFAGRTTGATSEAPQRWCGECPKCVFTFLMLATRLSPEQLKSIFGADLLATTERNGEFEALWSEVKPLECVGERSDAAGAMVALADDPRWAMHAAVVALHSS
ncbi:MAG: hypothetical protein HKN24_09965, partial [Acidimicrobiales bacterium]|nr:hypothetical protein [Acidimicrobiales bacterium]